MSLIAPYIAHLCKELFPGQAVSLREGLAVQSLAAAATQQKIAVEKGSVAVVYKRVIQHDQVLISEPSGDSYWNLTEQGASLQQEFLYVPADASQVTQRYECSLIRHYRDQCLLKLATTGNSGIDLATASGKLLIWYVVLTPLSASK